MANPYFNIFRKPLVKQCTHCKLQWVPLGGFSGLSLPCFRIQVLSLILHALCWFQTSLPLCRVIIACCFRVAALSGNAALALSPSGIAPELNRIQLSAICRGGQSGKVIDLLAWHCLPLGHPSAASGACAVEQISSSKRQCGKRQVSLKPALGMSLPLASKLNSFVIQWRSLGGMGKADCHPWQEKNAKNWEKEGKIRKRGKKGKIRKGGNNREGSFTLLILTDRAGNATVVIILFI